MRLVVCQPETDVDQVADGHSVHSALGTLTAAFVADPVEGHDVRPAAQDGTRQTYTLDRVDGKFDSCASPGCHGCAVDRPPPPGRRGAACRCSSCIGKVDGGNGHGGYGAYNEALVLLRGYRIKLTSATGKYVILDGRIIRNRSHILLANKVDGAPT